MLTNLDTLNPYVMDKAGPFIMEKLAIIWLLHKEAIFIFPAEETNNATLYVYCTNVFSAAVDDRQPIPYDEIENLYNAIKHDGYFGKVKWCCLQRNMKPQESIINLLKTVNMWTPELEALPINIF